ncbi:MAG: hypothetical protein D6E12_08485 [Desulfovibrio sp.]|nr:MAG: hypothetical protein D6E12_08485 [Desulfovibrio sp.]
MSKQIHIFATRDDIVQLTSAVEARHEVKYLHLPPGAFSKVNSYDSLQEFKHLGVSRAKDHMSGDCFFVMHKGVRHAVQKSLGMLPFIRHAMDQASNPHSVVLRPGGLYKKKHLICGHIGTISNSQESLELFQAFRAAARSLFSKIQSYHVGEEAEQMLSQGMRLITMGIDQPVDYDLKR